ncbi:putative Zn(II)2Cys6 transcription factor [Aspergillus mulundensis]|uniref:Putative Zn(II)2Cys6 transcription factor n=1 Tax=Aspergillus mulundensis TaxID=1810919 RepID=A0A3D8SV26_9EURO|nr:putative Zn(II)2Cys6 transcription factor [Aspergillus mulundensis]RDW90124.1 putative Zn(II)2Cys6 transcription factor [Aspergillus mulundensis]
MNRSLSMIAPKPLSSSSPSAASTPPDYAILKPKSCLACRKRKVRCDRQLPCTNCSRWSIECIFPSPIRRCPRARTKPDASSSSDQALRDKIRALEAQVSDLTETINTQASRILSPDALNGSLFPLSHTWAHAIAPLHPSSDQGRKYWQTFLERIDPLIKVVHQPSAFRILRSGLSDPTLLDEGEGALLQVFYLACVSAMDATDVQSILQMSKSTALSTYRLAAEQALARSGFITTSNWTTLQALVLFIALSRLQNDQKSAWNLAGLAERLEVSMEEDSSFFGAEMRRRVRWHLWYLNRRIRDDRGQSSTLPNHSNISPFSVELPFNCHDSELSVDMTTPPITQTGWTTMSFCLLRYDLATTERIVESDAPWVLKANAVKECQHRIQSNYLNHCDGTESIHWLASHISYVMITEMWMKLYSPQFTTIVLTDPLDDTVRNQLFDAAIDILDTRKRLEDETASRKWEWTLGGYFQYVPLTFLLNELHWRQTDPRVGAAWDVAERSFRRLSDDAKKSAHGVILTELMSSALFARQEAASSQVLSDSYFVSEQAIFDDFPVDSAYADAVDTVPSDMFQLGLPAEWAVHTS